MNTKWIKEASRLEQSGIDFVMVSVLSIKGSTPREVGARMLVTQQHSYQTIGGGHLEYKAIAYAHEILHKASNLSDGSDRNQLYTKDFPLGATLGQCCGGFVTLLFESVIQEKFHIAIFGAGHVGKAIIHCLEQLPCQVSWIDSRLNEFPTETANHIKKQVFEFPVDTINEMPSNTYYLVLTHNHQLDLELCEAILKRQDAAFLGVIGSKTKSARFRHRLRDKGFSTEQIARMHCPMGEESITSKQPGIIAVSTLSQILKIKENHSKTINTPQVDKNQMQEKQMKGENVIQSLNSTMSGEQK